MIEDRVNYVFKFFHLLFKIFTYGWVAEIIIFFLTMSCLFILLLFAVNHKLFRYLFKDRFNFVKVYMFYFFRQKIFFIRGFFRLFQRQTLKVIGLGIGLLIVGAFVLFLLIKYVF